MTGAALQLRPCCVALGGGAGSDSACVIPWTVEARRRAAARVATGGASKGSRPPRRPGGRIVLWPVRFWPQCAADIDKAIIQAWRLYSYGLIDSVEVAIRETEYRAMREWVR